MKVHAIKSVDDTLSAYGGEIEERAHVLVSLLEDYGHLLRMPFSKVIMPGIFELRDNGKYKTRLIYAFHNDGAVIFHVYLKKTQKIPKKEIDNIRAKYRAMRNDLLI